MADVASGVAKFGLESVLRLRIMFRIFVFVQSIQCILSAWESSGESRKDFPPLFSFLIRHLLSSLIVKAERGKGRKEEGGHSLVNTSLSDRGRKYFALTTTFSQIIHQWKRLRHQDDGRRRRRRRGEGRG